ncbi:WRKY transcription factor WRKY24-like [Eucalyptus grandis]|uniref:WRKY transcription factor WRKY24-like n=1 Tax=Eucalyptus grandis TaxID=71139 RepID=UPI00192EA2C6|nr:WRKY transcription factor WRKY24-like [Eucalyptus grandis]
MASPSASTGSLDPRASSLSSLLASALEDDPLRGSGVPKFKSISPPSLPLSALPLSPSAIPTMPPGLSPADFLDSKVSPPLSLPPRSKSSDSYQQIPKGEDANGSTFTLQTNAKQQSQAQSMREQTDDGYNWRKYGQKQAKGSKNPSSYYKCTHPHCPTKKKVERSLDGQITEMVYKGCHNHPKPQATRRSSASSASSVPSLLLSALPLSPSAFPTMPPGLSPADFLDSKVSPPLSLSPRSKSPDSYQQIPKREDANYSTFTFQTNAKQQSQAQSMREQRKSDDGYNWRKYGQKQVKGSENPWHYYKCTHPECPTKKKVERSLDGQITEIVYKGTHNHAKPLAIRRSLASSASSVPSLAVPVYNPAAPKSMTLLFLRMAPRK